MALCDGPMQWMAKSYLLALALLGWSAVILQIVLIAHFFKEVRLPITSGIIEALSFFTVLTNILVAIVVTASLIHGKPDTFLTRPSTMTAAAVYIILVGVIYSLFLRPLWNPVGYQLAADVALHGLTPILYPIYWLIFVPKGKLKWLQPVYWLIYPLLYVAYSLLRGLMINSYLYPFADITTLGYEKVFINTTILLCTFLSLGLVMVAMDRAIARFQKTKRR
jgi:hypothetical protein